MDSHLADSLDQIIKRLDQVQNEQSKFDRLLEQVDTIQSILQTQDQKQYLQDKKLEILTNFDSLLDKKLATMAHFENLLDKKLADITKLDSLLDKKLLDITNSDDMLDKKLSNIKISDNLLDKKLSDITNIDSLLDKKLSDTTKIDSLLDKKLSDLTNIDSLLDKKLTDLTNVFWQENNTMLQEIKDTQKGILDYVCAMPNDATFSPESTQEVLATDTESHQTLCRCEDDVNETKDECGKLNQKTQTSLQVDSIYQIEKESEVNAAQTVIHEREEAAHVLDEVNSISDLVRCDTRVELARLDSQLNKRLDIIETNFHQNLQQLTQEINKSTAQSDWVVCVLKEKGLIPPEINSSFNPQPENVDAVMSMMIKMREFQFSLDNRQKIMTDKLAAFSLQQDSLKTKLEQCTQDVKNYIYKSKMEIFAVTEKEAQIVRDRIEGPLACHGEYVFDFYVDSFKMLVRSERDVHSPPWHINEMKSCMMGMIWFPPNGNMEVCFVFARHPREVGLQPTSAIKLKVKSSICDIHKKALPGVDIGEKVWTVKERNISCNFDWGCKLGILSCDHLLEKGYGQKEEYRFGALLVRFCVSVCLS